MRNFVVHFDYRCAEGKRHQCEEVFEAKNALNAIGQACLRFSVRTDDIVSLRVSEKTVVANDDEAVHTKRTPSSQQNKK